MGYETKCHARVDDGSGTIREANDATVLLETDDLVVRGVARVKISRTSIQRLTVRAGILAITAPNATLTLTLGNAASTWRTKLAEPPKRLIDKLDVKPEARVWLFHAHEQTLIEQLRGRTANVLTTPTASGCDVVFVGVEQLGDLDRIDRAMAATRENGAVWVIHPKGKTGVANTAIFAKATAIGLKYVKVARVSQTHTAEKLVRPLASRRR